MFGRIHGQIWRIDRLISRVTNWLIEWLTDQVDWLVDLLTDRLVNWLIDPVIKFFGVGDCDCHNFIHLFVILSSLFTALLSHLDSPKRYSGRFPQGKPAAIESRYGTYGTYWLF